jgi:hypothetical protein
MTEITTLNNEDAIGSRFLRRNRVGVVALSLVAVLAACYPNDHNIEGGFVEGGVVQEFNETLDGVVFSGESGTSSVARSSIAEDFAQAAGARGVDSGQQSVDGRSDLEFENLGEALATLADFDLSAWDRFGLIIANFHEIYKQADYAGVQWGKSTDIALAGCGPTAMANAFRVILGDESIDPPFVAKLLNNGIDYSNSSNGAIYHEAFEEVVDKMDEDGVTLRDRGINVSEPIYSLEEFKDGLDRGGIIIFRATGPPISSGRHVVLAVGYGEGEREGQLMVVDSSRQQAINLREKVELPPSLRTVQDRFDFDPTWVDFADIGAPKGWVITYQKPA